MTQNKYTKEQESDALADIACMNHAAAAESWNIILAMAKRTADAEMKWERWCSITRDALKAQAAELEGTKAASEELKQLKKDCAELKEHNEVLAKEVTELGERLDRCNDARIAVEAERDALKNSRDAANVRSTEDEPRAGLALPRSTVEALRAFTDQWAHWHPHADGTRSPVNAAAALVVELTQLLGEKS